MNPRTTEQNTKLWALLAKLGWKDKLPDLARAYTEGRTCSSKEMGFREMEGLLKYLEKEVAKVPVPAASLTADAAYIRSIGQPQRMKVIALAYQLKWERWDEAKKRMVCDYKLLDAFLLKRGAVKKRLNELVYSELTDVITQLERLLATGWVKTASELRGELGV